MPGSKTNQEIQETPSTESADHDDSEDESEILEESPCGRWLKRREEVKQRDVPGIDVAYLAMDTEEGVEVVWNEVQFSERKNFKSQEDKIRQVFENLTQLDHPNIVKFHKYWTDTKNDQPRVIFITEYMSSGSLKQFLKKTKQTKKLPRPAWKRWCTQILSALDYLHSCTPPIIHGNLTCDTIFIQHNGLVKIGSGHGRINDLAPDAIHHHVKTCRENMKNMHFIAPEYGVKSCTVVTPAVDIYSFGMCALEMAALEIPGNSETGTQITEDVIMKTIESLDDPIKISFINTCLNKNPHFRPSARNLLFHAVLFEVHSLRLLAAHSLVNNPNYLPESLPDVCSSRNQSSEEASNVVAEIDHADGRPGVQIKYTDIQQNELEKFLEDVRNGIFPLTSIAVQPSKIAPQRAASPEVAETVKMDTPEPVDVESRRIMDMMCTVKIMADQIPWITLFLKMDDKVNRQISGPLNESDSSALLAKELVHHGLINDADSNTISNLIEDTLNERKLPSPNVISASAS